MYKFGWFSTGRGKGAQKLLEAAHTAIANGDINGSISFVFCSREPGEASETDNFISQVKSYGIPIICFSYQKYKAKHETEAVDEKGFPLWRLEYDREVMKRISGYDVNLCMLAGYMLVVGKEMCTKYDMVNLHPALPNGPKGTWREVIWELMENKAAETGAMLHLATPELDRGPVVAYCRFSLLDEPFKKLWKSVEGKTIADIKKTEGEQNELFKTIRHYGLSREFPLIISTMKSFAARLIHINNGKIFKEDGSLIEGYDLSETIDAQLESI